MDWLQTLGQKSALDKSIFPVANAWKGGLLFVRLQSWGSNYSFSRNASSCTWLSEIQSYLITLVSTNSSSHINLKKKVKALLIVTQMYNQHERKQAYSSLFGYTALKLEIELKRNTRVSNFLIICLARIETYNSRLQF